MMHEPEKSDPSIRAKKPANNPGQPGAEPAEQREGTEGNTGTPRTRRTQSRGSVSPGLDRVREAAKQDKKERFTARLHHVTPDLLKEAFFGLKREAAPGVDGQTWQGYKQNLKPTSPICTGASTRAPTERCLPNGGISPNLTGDSARWALPPWKIKSLNGPSWRCSMPSTKKTSWASRTGFDRDAASTMRWTR
jgi:hypothetical protein